MKNYVSLILLLAALNGVGAAFAEDETTSEMPNQSGNDIFSEGKLLLDARYRFELKDQDGFADEAYANTLRTRLGFETGEFQNFKFLVELENIVSIGDDHYNSTTNGQGQFPVIADPETTELNRAQITYTGLKKTKVTVGRQRINLANQRFVGAVGFRQNEQTFDAVRIGSSFIDNLAVEYIYIDRVRRIFGDDHPLGEFDSSSHIFSAKYDAKEFGQFTGYGILLDFDEAPALSSETFGVRYETKLSVGEGDSKLGVIAEYAVQEDRANNPISYSEDYFLGELSLAGSAGNFKAGFESLGGNGTIGFSTPLATLHKFQGYADVFLNTPAAGVEDTYVGYSYNVSNPPVGEKAKFFMAYHEFEAENTGADFGSEFDIGVSVGLNDHWSAEFKAASYNGDSGFADRDLVWFSLRYGS